MYANSPEELELREKNRKIIEYYFQTEHNSPEQLALYAPDCQWEQPYFRPGESGPLFPSQDDGPGPELPEGFEMPEFTPEWHWGPTKIYGTDDPNYFIAENSGHGLQLIGDNTLQPYENYYFHTFKLQNGKIVYYREIANPLNLMRTMQCRFEPLPQPEETLEKLIACYNSQKN